MDKGSRILSDYKDLCLLTRRTLFAAYKSNLASLVTSRVNRRFTTYLHALITLLRQGLLSILRTFVTSREFKLWERDRKKNKNLSSFEWWRRITLFLEIRHIEHLHFSKTSEKRPNWSNRDEKEINWRSTMMVWNCKSGKKVLLPQKHPVTWTVKCCCHVNFRITEEICHN